MSEPLDLQKLQVIYDRAVDTLNEFNLPDFDEASLFDKYDTFAGKDTPCIKLHWSPKNLIRS